MRVPYSMLMSSRLMQVAQVTNHMMGVKKERESAAPEAGDRSPASVLSQCLNTPRRSWTLLGGI